MSEVFKCGDIANIINDNKEVNKKQTKVSKKLKNIFEENKNKIKIIEIKKIIKNEVKEESEESDDCDDSHHNNDEEVDEEKRKEEIIEKNERTAFVGNLPKTVTQKSLRKMFSRFGKIESIRLRGAVPEKEKMSKKVAAITKSLHPKKDNIIAYIVFKDKNNVLSSLEMNGKKLSGHHIRVDRAANDQTHDSSRSVFIGNLPFEVTEDEIYEFFEDCGDIEAVRVVRDSNTGVGKGFGFVLFKSKDSVVLALEKNQKKLRKREIRVTIAKTHNKNKLQLKQKTNNSQKLLKKSDKKSKKSDSRPDFEGISAKKTKKKIKKKKEMKTIKAKKSQKKLAQIFSK